MTERHSRKLQGSAARLLRDRGGNFGMLTALLIPVLLVTAGGALDVTLAMAEKARLQGELDAAVLAAARDTDAQGQLDRARGYMSDLPESSKELAELAVNGTSLALVQNPDGSLTANFSKPHRTYFLGLIGMDEIPLGLTATAMTSGEKTGGACIYALGNQNQAVLINSGANLKSENCEVHVHSTSSPAFIMNAGARIETRRFCVKGTQNIRNGGTLTNLETGCAAEADPYAGKLPEPVVPSTCTTQGTKDGQRITMKPGLHCGTTFNGSPTVTFEPGLHIIRGRMIINSGATVIAEGVTFYFPDVDSELRANGGLTFTATAPTTGPYAGILMFEKTSDPNNNRNKRQYIFNGSRGEILKGIIHLPNRDVTYNSTTNQKSQISLVVNTIIMNSANWQVEPYEATASSSSAGGVRLTQ
ncbi:pilus assembly protein [Peteryoungia desertarenae]|uniref:Pilus assembly protein n=1 Tax=Peteryoungia desertarenae TaxID=1813451 RepID=A0ABX6QMJ4_9HYPH|nr:TadE/TadG family type IV pilus assembly protein [Peteryoungia desertarenae]QLF69821.1 pilus assembly protein [Peteryoungia desertarenae]